MAAGLKRAIGMFFLVLGFLAPLLSPIGFWLGMEPASAAIVAALLVFGLPEVFWVIAAVFLGPEIFHKMKAKWKSFRKDKHP